ncbi:MAG: glycerol kinase GlpK [Bdellovibrionota bacterium]
MKKYILSIDQGTTSSRVFIYDDRFQVVGMAQHAFPQHFPKADWVEHDLTEIWRSVEESIEDALKSVSRPEFHASQIAAIGITNQRETFGVWDKKTGKAAHRAIVWQCRRSAAICERLRKNKKAIGVAKASGLVLDPYFSGTKLKWLLDEDKTIRSRAQKGELLFGTMDTFLVWKLSNGRSHVTDTTNASRTLLMDLKKLQWNPEALKLLGIPAAMLPEIKSSNGEFGTTKGLRCLPDGIPIRGVLGDQHAALLGQACLSPGETKVTYGTGAFLVMNTGPTIKRSRKGLSTVAWTFGNKTTYALEGSVFIAGAAVQWLRDELKIVEKSSDIETLASKVKDSDGVFFIPALSGLGSPYWAPHAKGLLGGLTRRSNTSHIARASLEGIAASIADVAEGLGQDAKIALKKISVDGGASANNILMQLQADLLRAKIVRPVDVETTVRGAAFAAALGVGWVTSPSELITYAKQDRVFGPQWKPAQTAEFMKVWRRRIKGLLAGAY